MSIAYFCPYFIFEKSKDFHCEIVRVSFPDKETRRDVVYGYCAHPEDYEKCPFKKALDRYYERRFKK